MKKLILYLFATLPIFPVQIAAENIVVPIEESGYCIEFDDTEWECQHKTGIGYKSRYYSVIEGKSLISPLVFTCWYIDTCINGFTDGRIQYFTKCFINGYKETLELELQYFQLKVKKNSQPLEKDKTDFWHPHYSIVSGKFSNSHRLDKNGIHLQPYDPSTKEGGQLMAYMIHSRNGSIGIVFMLIKAVSTKDSSNENKDFWADENRFEKVYSLIKESN